MAMRGNVRKLGLGIWGIMNGKDGGKRREREKANWGVVGGRESSWASKVVKNGPGFRG
ncbi:hypothetical protein GE21DRAFT_1293139 [Neurospora crassa]|nr:hypothetical protein GE21DRAFT_1293139 [Neurospora crassa]